MELHVELHIAVHVAVHEALMGPRGPAGPSCAPWGPGGAGPNAPFPNGPPLTLLGRALVARPQWARQGPNVLHSGSKNYGSEPKGTGMYNLYRFGMF